MNIKLVIVLLMLCALAQFYVCPFMCRYSIQLFMCLCAHEYASVYSFYVHLPLYLNSIWK
jgi:hypothetical protein